MIAKPESTFAEHALADSPEYLEIARDRKAGAQAIVLLAKGIYAGDLRAVSRYHHQGPKPNPNVNGAGV